MPSGQRNARLWGLTQLRNATMSNVTEAMTRRATAVNAVAGSTRQRKVRGCFDWVGLWIGAEGGLDRVDYSRSPSWIYIFTDDAFERREMGSEKREGNSRKEEHRAVETRVG